MMSGSERRDRIDPFQLRLLMQFWFVGQVQHLSWLQKEVRHLVVTKRGEREKGDFRRAVAVQSTILISASRALVLRAC